MPNFHANFLVITANEQDMCNVLDRFAANIAASNVDDDFSLGQYERSTSLQERYYEVLGAIEYNYMWALSSSPAGSEGYSTGVPIQIGDATVTIAVAPHGRGVSDSANVSMIQYGDVWTFTLNYDTAWNANTDDIDSFFSALPLGEYGVAFYDADEGDGYDSVCCFCGLHHGMGMLHSASPIVRDTYLDARDLKAERRNESMVRRSETTDLAEISRITATRDWPQYWFYEEDDEGEYYETLVDGKSLDSWGRSTRSAAWGMPTVNWLHPTDSDLQKIDDTLVKDLAGLPWMRRVDTTTPQGAEAAESLMAGDLLIGRTHWADLADNTTIEILDTNGVKLSTLKKWEMQLGYEGSWQSLSGICSISCLMPHLVFHVVDVKPMSLRNKGVDRAEITLRIDAAQVDLPALFDEVHELLALEPADRMRTSIATEVR